MNYEMAIRLRNDRIAAHPGLNGLMPRWSRALVGKMIDACKHFTLPKIVDSIADQVIADFRAKHVLNGLDLTATDSEIVETARRRADTVAVMMARLKDEWAIEAVIATTCQQANVPTPKGDTLDARKKRISCPRWWARKLRTVHARAIENGNIKLGFVQARRDPYASRDALTRCLRQEERNRLMMEKVMLENENGDCFSLQELADLSTSNKAIRRAELMTRVRGMEDYANEFGYVAYFVTITCPSYFHSKIKGSGLSNPLYRGKTPRQGQDYLCNVWGKVRAKLDREGVTTFGMRVAEPHHDGCPHWHLIMFVKPHHAVALESIVKHYALLDSPDEPGAKQYRCDFKEITAEKGSATGYIAKYIAKNIDGYKLENDLTGEPAITASLHVTAWAKTHGIRQFQAFGAGSVMVWRELRRIPFSMMKDAPKHLLNAWHAAQKTLSVDGETERRADYSGYLKATGGAAIPRKHEQIKLAKLHDDTLGRYGEALGERPIGIYTVDEPLKVYESTRYTWKRIDVVDAVNQTIASDAQSQAKAVLKNSGIGSTWTRVNNCTHGIDAEAQSIPFWMENQFFKNPDFDRMRC